MEKITIPDEYVEKIKNHHMLDEMLDIEVEISKAKYDDAVKGYNKENALAAKKEGRAAAIESKKNHEEMWAVIAEAIPATKEGRWVLDASDWTLTYKSGRNPASGLGDLLSSLRESMETAR